MQDPSEKQASRPNLVVGNVQFGSGSPMEAVTNWSEWERQMKGTTKVTLPAFPYMNPIAEAKHSPVAEGAGVDAEAKAYTGEEQYLDLLQELVDEYEANKTRETRNDDATASLFGRQFRFDMEYGFPLLTTKKLFTKGIIAELLWFIAGSTNVRSLQEQGVRIWDEWADPETGELGPVYGAQWRGGTENSVDQLAKVIESLTQQPYGRRHIIDSWNPKDIPDMALPPCHCLIQFYVGSDERLHLQLYQRSADIFLGVPFNIASYALLLHIVAEAIGRDAGEFIHTFGDVHLYANHIEAAKLQLTRKPTPFPDMWIEPLVDQAPLDYVEQLKLTDIHIEDYKPHPSIPAPVSK